MAIREPTCREVARWLFSEFEQKMPDANQEALQRHMAICEACVRIRFQVTLIHQAVEAWLNYRDNDEGPVLELAPTATAQTPSAFSAPTPPANQPPPHGRGGPI
jgi:hypothetical protein